MDNVTLDDVNSFRRTNAGEASWIEGHLLGLELPICEPSDLARMKLPSDVLVDVDIDFFVTVPGDRLGTAPIDIAEVIQVLAPEMVTIARSVQSGFTPLRYRFLADWIAAALAPSLEVAGHYQRLMWIDEQLQSGDRKIAHTEFEKELQSFLNFAASHDLASLASESLEQRPLEQRNCEFASAVALCDDYEHNALRSATEMLARGVMSGRDELTAMTRAVLEEPCSNKDCDVALTAVALGLVWCEIGDIVFAEKCYHMSLRKFESHPELAIEIANLYLNHLDRPEPFGDALQQTIERFAEIALADDKSRVMAQYCLAVVRLRKGDLRKGELDGAAKLLEEIVQCMPMWDLPRILLANVKLAQGSRVAADRMIQQVQQHQQVMDSIIQRMGRPISMLVHPTSGHGDA